MLKDETVTADDGNVGEQWAVQLLSKMTSLVLEGTVLLDQFAAVAQAVLVPPIQVKFASVAIAVWLAALRPVGVAVKVRLPGTAKAI